MTNFELHIEGARETADKLVRFQRARIMSETADTVMPALVTALKLAAPKRTGRLADRIRVMRSTSIAQQSVTLTAVVDVPYARYVLEGTQPHTISANHAQSLRWYDQMGDAVFAKTVHNPGMKANHFPRRVWRGLREPVMLELLAQVRRKLHE